uniref:(S)-ureidoglycine aminohydrolase cupin domain-containing protein n=1 Tax=Helicotheca tamesis TaxID=374047 RepID=A0A7S2HDH5_9STRA|mmetsp:Transcript_17228/g.23694  ORF Transcript_17228/g.23694 Transcript_17228/m.23694 type:complete len:325 (+) Transcript_17228:37-1011(+)
MINALKMKTCVKPIALLSLVVCSASFQPIGRVPQHRTSTPLYSYLDSLQQEAPQASTQPSVAVNGAVSAPVQAEASTATPSFISEWYGDIGYFGLDNLRSKGPRPTADWGTPADATRKLADDGTLRTGSWWCSEGGWPSSNPKGATEIFYVVSGNGCLSDKDGMKHYFGPGDTVIIPKGHEGRWDVFSDIHKIWAVNAHERIEDPSPVIRVQVDGYHTFAPQYLTKNTGYDPLYSSSYEGISFNTFYDVGPTKTGVWTCGAGSFPVTNGKKSFFHLLEGVLFVTDGASGLSRRCEAGDTMMLPEGWCGHIDVIEPSKKLWTTAE